MSECNISTTIYVVYFNTEKEEKFREKETGNVGCRAGGRREGRGRGGRKGGRGWGVGRVEG